MGAITVVDVVDVVGAVVVVIVVTGDSLVSGGAVVEGSSAVVQLATRTVKQTTEASARIKAQPRSIVRSHWLTPPGRTFLHDVGRRLPATARLHVPGRYARGEVDGTIPWNEGSPWG